MSEIIKFAEVAKNANGVEDINYGRYKSPNVEYITIPESEFSYLNDGGYIDEINDVYDEMLGEFESAFIVGNFEPLLSIAERTRKECPAFYESVNKANSYGYAINFEF